MTKLQKTRKSLKYQFGQSMKLLVTRGLKGGERGINFEVSKGW